jgi:hypothetical protein
VRNAGTTMLVVEDWDAFVQHYGIDGGLTEPTLHIQRPPYNALGDVNTWPHIGTLNLLTVAGATSAVLTDSELFMEDNDHPADQRVYTLVTVPVHGILIFDGNESQPLSVGAQFTQADISLGRVAYLHLSDGPADSFQFAIADAAILNATVNQWAVAGIYTDAEANIPETYNPGILDPGEELALHISVAPPIAHDTAVRVAVATDNGVSASTVLTSTPPQTFAISIQPYITVNNGLSVLAGGSAALQTNALLAYHDAAPAADLVYTITVAPAFGMLYLDTTPLGVGSAFTQADLQSEPPLLRYEHLSGGSDSFWFTVSDDVRTTGEYEFVITVG